MVSSTKLFPKTVCSTKYTPSCSPLVHLSNKENNLIRDKGSTIPLPNEANSGMIAMEHCYARPLNWKPDTTFYQPTKLLFVQNNTIKKKSIHPLALNHEPEPDVDAFVDVEFVPPTATELYDKAKAINLMEECDRHIEITKAYQTDDDWEESIIKTNWSNSQYKLFNEIASILNKDMLARLAQVGVHHEPIHRRVLIDKSVKRVRRIFATISWETRLSQWLHQLLLDHLSPSYLSAYLDILQTLREKLPGFVDKMMYGPNSTSRIGPTSIENMFQLLKRPWDPFSSYLTSNKPRKLPGNPVVIIVPSAPSTSNITQFKRQHKWMNLLANLSTVVAVHTNIGSNANRLTMINCADQMLTATRAKVQEVKVDYSGRAIILVGFNAGAALALQVAQVESVFCVVCMGFSVLTVDGKRGDPDDNLLELQCPVLFVIGQCSNTSSQEDVEDLRERMRVENGLIIVGAADDNLRVNKKTKKAEGITQTAVDRIIVESVGEFVSGLILSPYPPQQRQSPLQPLNEVPATKQIKLERGRNTSNCSSLESEPPSPTPKITRPVGRPPGSKTKSKLETKWSTQVAQGTSPSRSQPSSLTQPVSKSQASTSSSPLPQTISKPKVTSSSLPSLHTISKPQVTTASLTPSQTISKPQASTSSLSLPQTISKIQVSAPSFLPQTISKTQASTSPLSKTRANTSPLPISQPIPKAQANTPSLPLLQTISKPQVTTSSLPPPHIISKPQTSTPPSVPPSLPNIVDIKRLEVTKTNNSGKDVSSDIVTDKSDKVESAARQQMMGLNRSIFTSGKTISNIVSAPSRICIPPAASKPTSAIRVLENRINSATSGKRIQNLKPGIDLSKITVVSSGNNTTSKNAPNVGNMIVMPDGKIKTIGTSIRALTTTSHLLPILQKNKVGPMQLPLTVKPGVSKPITSKKQLLGQKPPYMPQRQPIVTSYSSNLLPPTNLTTQDIMDLPIIFADDNKMLTDNAQLQQVDVPVSEIMQPIQPPKLQLSNPVGKFVFLNKPQPMPPSLAAPVLKRPSLSVPVRTTTNPMKFAKIIISHALTTETKTAPVQTSTLAKITHLSPEISIRRIEAAKPVLPVSSNLMDPGDVENTLIATAIPKPEYTVTIKKEPGLDSMSKFERSIEVIKRNAIAASLRNAADDNDPDYVPPKSVKLK